MTKYTTRGLTLDNLREANKARLKSYRNPKGELVHKNGEASSWALSAWCNATLGELGEAANIIKKIERGDFGLEEARDRLAGELADVLTYLDLLALSAGIDLNRATIRKWNEVSRRVGASVEISENYIIVPDEEGE